jgi:hypothetical protein
MAYVIPGGLANSTLLDLFILPVVYGVAAGAVRLPAEPSRVVPAGLAPGGFCDSDSLKARSVTGNIETRNLVQP